MCHLFLHGVLIWNLFFLYVRQAECRILESTV